MTLEITSFIGMVVILFIVDWIHTQNNKLEAYSDKMLPLLSVLASLLGSLLIYIAITDTILPIESICTAFVGGGLMIIAVLIAITWWGSIYDATASSYET